MRRWWRRKEVKSPKVQGSQGPRYLKVTFKYELDSKEGPSCYILESHLCCSANDLWTNYEQAKSWLKSKKLPPDVDIGGVFCNDRLDLGEVDVYGFDYDYTLASYKKQVEYLIHDIAQQHLVRKYGYPDGIAKLIYDPLFPVRGRLLFN